MISSVFSVKKQNYCFRVVFFVCLFFMVLLCFVFREDFELRIFVQVIFQKVHSKETTKRQGERRPGRRGSQEIRQDQPNSHKSSACFCRGILECKLCPWVVLTNGKWAGLSHNNTISHFLNVSQGQKNCSTSVTEQVLLISLRKSSEKKASDAGCLK